MNKEKTVYLFGAGAAIPWEAPITSRLTELILNSGFYCVGNEKRVTKKIFEELCNNFSKCELNFESILNVIEELLIYFSKRDYLKTNSYVYPFLSNKNFLSDIFNYQKPSSWGHGSKLNIPNGFELENNKVALRNQGPEQYYLELLYANILTNIASEIVNYSLHTTVTSKIETQKYNTLNDSFANWIKSNENAINRLYTLNYDRIFSVILKNRNLDIFEGAKCGAILPVKDKLPFDLNKISTDFDCDVHYNLHGSIFWDIETRNHNGFIITGYQKTQKTALSPFRQMQSAFDRDCLTATKIIIVGYSFGDAHLNETIKTALICNQDISIDIIDPNFRKNNLDRQVYMSILSNSLNLIEPKNLTEKSCSFLHGKVVVYEEYFDKYLNSVFIR